MNLNLTQIASVTAGAVRVEEVPGGIRFYRFTEEQMQLYSTTSFAAKTYATAGVRLRFYTDSRTLALKAEITAASSRKFFRHEIFVNGTRIGSFGNGASASGSAEGRFDLGKGEKLVEVYFPWSASSVLKSLTLDDGASLIPAHRPKKMILFGDSITQGYDAQNPSAAYSSRLSDFLDADAVNKGIGGEIFFPPLAAARDGFELDYISVAYGTNDWSKCTLQNFEENCAAFYKTLAETYPNARIFALTPIWRKDRDRVTKVGSFDYVKEYIEKTVAPYPNVTPICGYTFVPEDEGYFSDRYLHPNDEGFDRYAENLCNAVKEALEHISQKGKG